MAITVKERKATKRIKHFVQSTFLSFPRKVACNICSWQGRHMLTDSWHKHIKCPNCRSSIRQRLFLACIEHLPQYSYSKIIDNRSILHFAPEETIKQILKQRTTSYQTTDFLRQDCDLQLDMSNMAQVAENTYDLVLAFDVLEHVPDYVSAIREVRRILRPGGYAIFTVPQKDHLEITYEDSAIVSREERTRHFGQWDHLRIFGNDFPKVMQDCGLDTTAIGPANFTPELVERYVLAPPELSVDPLATNYRKVFFGRKS